jgi:carbamate kinase
MTAGCIADMVAAGWNVVLTHGNGPQVGFIMRRSELSIHEVPPVPMDYAGADIQGAIGYMFDRAFRNEFRRRGIDRKPIAVVTQTIVDSNDPAFANPSKPIGSYMEEATAKRIAGEQGWTVREDAGRGWRRVVPSPQPKSIVELDEIRFLVRAGYLVIACGGGGIPVVQDAAGDLIGVEAVIDKDYAASMLAGVIGADLLLVLTGVEKVAVDFNTPKQRWIDHLSVEEAPLLRRGPVRQGKHGPKIKAAIQFVDGGGSEALITDCPNIARALAGETGTRIRRH